MKKSIRIITCAALLLSLAACKDKVTDVPKGIRKVEKIAVESPEGTVPRLPYQVWVTYNDGTQGYRQIRWENSALATEKEQSDASLYPAGKRYEISGYVIG